MTVILKMNQLFRVGLVKKLKEIDVLESLRDVSIRQISKGPLQGIGMIKEYGEGKQSEKKAEPNA